MMVAKRQLKHLSTEIFWQYQHDNRKWCCRYYRVVFSCYDTVFDIVTALLRTQNRKNMLFTLLSINANFIIINIKKWLFCSLLVFTRGVKW
jgi:hypothetical protein